MNDDMPVAAGPIIAGLAEIVDAIKALAESNRGENPAPTIFPVAAVNRTHVRLRVTHWVIAGDNAANTDVVLQVGTSAARTVELSPTLTTLVIPLPIEIERGTDVVAVGGTIVDSWLIAYPE